MKRRGRPCKDDNKKMNYHIRMTEDDAKMLEYLTFETGKSRSDILRNGLRMQYNLKIGR